MQKKLLLVLFSCLLAVSCIFSLCACDDGAEEESCQDLYGLKFAEITDINGEKAYEVVDYDGTYDNVIIPSEYLGKPVISIGKKAFYGKRLSLLYIAVPNSIINIADDFLVNCNFLHYNSYDNALYVGNESNPYLVLVKAKSQDVTSCIINSDCRFICRYAFANCSLLYGITIPNSVTSIMSYAFGECSQLLCATIGNNVISIGERAFSGCKSLIRISMPKSVKSIGDSAFDQSDSARNIYYGGDINDWVKIKFGGSSYIGNFYINNRLVKEANITGVEEVNSYSLGYCESLESVIVGDDVTNIGEYAFFSCKSLQSAVIGKNVNDIGERAFASCSLLKNLIIGDGVINIEARAFYCCRSLTSVKIPKSIRNMGSSIFAICESLQSVIIEDGVPYIGDNAFAFCSSLEEVVIPNSVTCISGYAFAGCTSLKSITFNDTTTWYRTSDSTSWQNKTGGILTDLSNSSTNATYFMSTYSDHYWYKL